MALHPEQIKILKALSPDVKLEIAEKLYASARALKTAALQLRHPHWSEEKVAERVMEIFLHART